MDSKRKTRRTEQSLHLPEEIIGQILARLRVKSLLRLRCVSKSWLSLIASKEFIKSHLQYSTKNTDSDHHRVLMYSVSNRKTKQCSLRALLEGTYFSRLGRLILPQSDFYASYCNGLLCVYQNGRFLLLNPSTRVSKELPKDPEIDYSDMSLSLRKFGFGWDESSGAYKVFTGWDVEKSRVYSSKTNSWKTVKDPYLHTSDIEGTFVGGKLYWLRQKRKIISSFDLKSEEFGTIELPAVLPGYYMSLGVVGGCLCLSVEYCCNDPERLLEIWMMKESLEKLVSIYPVRIGQSIDLIGEAANGEILIAYGSSLLVCCPRNGVIRHQTSFPEACCFKALYVESLVSPVKEISSRIKGSCSNLTNTFISK